MESGQVKKKKYIKKILSVSLFVILLSILGLIVYQSREARKHVENTIENIRDCDTIMSVWVYEDSDYLDIDFEAWNPRNESLNYYSREDTASFVFTSPWLKYRDIYEYSYDHTMHTWGKHKRLHEETSINAELMTFEQQDLVGISRAYKQSPVKMGFKFKADSKIKGDIACIKLESFNRNAESRTLFAISSDDSNCAVLTVGPRDMRCAFNGTSFEIDRVLIKMLQDSYYDKELWRRVGNFLLDTGFGRNRIGTELQLDIIKNVSAEHCKIDGNLKGSIDILKDDSIVMFQENESNIVMRHKNIWYSISESETGEVVYKEHKPDTTDLIEFMKHVDELKYTKNSEDNNYLSDMAYSLYPYTRKTSGGTELHFTDITDFITGESWGILPADQIREIPENELDELGRKVLDIIEK